MNLTAEFLPVLEKGAHAMLNALKGLMLFKDQFAFIGRAATALMNSVINVFNAMGYAFAKGIALVSSGLRELMKLGAKLPEMLGGGKTGFFAEQAKDFDQFSGFMNAMGDMIGNLGHGELPGFNQAEPPLGNAAADLRAAAEKLEESADQVDRIGPQAQTRRTTTTPGLAPALLKGTAEAISFANKLNLPKFTRLERDTERTADAAEETVAAVLDLTSVVSQIMTPVVVEFT